MKKPPSLQRREKIEIKMRLDKKAYKLHKEAVVTLVGKQKMEPSDDLIVTYKFYCDYFGNVVNYLQAVEEICADPDIIKEADCSALEEGRILIYEVLRGLEAVIRRVKGIAQHTEEGTDDK